MSLELFFEVGVEEIPARFLPGAIAGLKTSLAGALVEARLPFESVETTATPRRLVGRVLGLGETQEDGLVERIGPPWGAAFDSQGAPTKVALGFAGSCGVEPEELEKIDTAKGPRASITKTIPGLPAREVIGKILTGVFGGLAWPKSMRWAREPTRFVRPVQWILVVLGGEKIDLCFAGVRSGEVTFGHRFHAPEPIRPRNYEDYVDRLRQAKVLVNFQERRDRIVAGLHEVAESLDGLFDEEKNEDLIDQVTGLVEWPRLYVGRIPEDSLSLPPAVLVSSMTHHQKYFSFLKKGGSELLPHFVAVGGVEAKDPAVVTRGYESVLNARLADARFFFDEDMRNPLGDLAKKLDGIIFHRKLGTYREKIRRMQRIGAWLAERFAPESGDDILRAVELSKADLLTAMVGEFPELQGLMGREYARRQGESEAVAVAIFEHYLPRFAGDALPSSELGALCSLSDKIDSIVACLGAGLGPTGSGDPYALRRQAQGVIQILEGRGWRLELGELVEIAILAAAEGPAEKMGEQKKEVLDFFRSRLAGMLKQRDVSPQVVEGSLAVRFQDVVEVMERAEAIEAFTKTGEYEAFATAFKRVANIIGDHAEGPVDESLFEDGGEEALWNSYRGIREQVSALVEEHRYGEALERIAGIRPQVDDFFDECLVMHEKKEIRENRLSLLTKVASLFADIADFRMM